jgi:hypothetical protein
MQRLRVITEKNGAASAVLLIERKHKVSIRISNLLGLVARITQFILLSLGKQYGRMKFNCDTRDSFLVSVLFTDIMIVV